MTTTDGAEQRKSIYRTAIVLTVLTAIEFIIAFSKSGWGSALGISQDTAMDIVVATFIVLTLFKAFYIVGEFMHLKQEIRGLIIAIIFPVVLVVWLLIAMISDGRAWGAKESVLDRAIPVAEATE